MSEQTIKCPRCGATLKRRENSGDAYRCGDCEWKGPTPEPQQYLGGCDCAFKAPTVPVYRDQMEHLADCPAKGSDYPVGAIRDRPS